MRKLILRSSVSIDGVLEAAGGKLDFSKTRGPEGAAWLAAKAAQAGAHLMGRKAFSEMAPFWPTAAGPMARPMNEIPKIVFSRRGFDPSTVTQAPGWADATVLAGDLAEGIRGLKAQPGKDLLAHGGVSFAQALVQTGLIDEYWLAVHPVAAGGGPGLFEKLSQPLNLTLVESKAFPSGALMNVYRPA